MPRPIKCRRVCRYPETLLFCPENSQEKAPVLLTIDEFETIRLIDKEGLSQEEAAGQLDVARTTVQRIYGAARRKLAEAIVGGLPLKIEGGDYRLCTGVETACPRWNSKKTQTGKGGPNMKIAVTYENGEIFQHFGHTEQFKVYQVEDGKVTSSQVVSTNGSGHGALAGLLQTMGVDTLICGGIGGGAQMALAEAGIRLFGGVSGSADEAVNALLSGSLAYNPDVRCSHHDHEHGGEAHSCGNQGCGHGHCGNH